ncbi:hypothetical protein BSKO_06733 [Bryopsis sp. KO-2023]|nr:hypothetical protein BSKO_06733 [Bryopsis sp. KO-2023]
MLKRRVRLPFDYEVSIQPQEHKAKNVREKQWLAGHGLSASFSNRLLQYGKHSNVSIMVWGEPAVDDHHCRTPCGDRLHSIRLWCRPKLEFNVMHGWIAGGSECEAVRVLFGVSARVILDTATLKKLDNDIETLANCMPPGAVLEFDLPELVLGDSVELRSPIVIEGNGASVRCPDDRRKGSFKIRCLE